MILLFLISVNTFGRWIGSLFHQGPIDVQITSTDNLKQIENNIFDLLFTDNEESYEIGLFFYSIDKSAAEQQKESIITDYNFKSNQYKNTFTNSWAKTKTELINSKNLKQINADSGDSTLINYNGRQKKFDDFDFAFNFAQINRYLKKDTGFVMVIIMFNDINLLKNDQFKKDIQIFKFK